MQYIDVTIFMEYYLIFSVAFTNSAFEENAIASEILTTHRLDEVIVQPNYASRRICEETVANFNACREMISFGILN